MILCCDQNSKHCADASRLYNSSYFDLTKFPINFQTFEFKQSSDKFAGKGHFSVVKRATLPNGCEVAVKELHLFKKRDLIKEIHILKALETVDHVVRLIGITGNETLPSLIYTFHKSIKNDYYNITMPRFKWWLRTLLETISNIHKHGVIHRDLKLGNILTDFEAKQLTIIDFGLAEFNMKKARKNPRVGCYRLKAPEHAIESTDYDCKSDIWSIGIACLDLMIGLRSNWVIKDNDMLIEKLITYFGSDTWNSFAEKYDSSYMIDFETKGDIFELAMPGHYELFTQDSWDLVQRFLVFDPDQRISAEEALNHPFFND